MKITESFFTIVLSISLEDERAVEKLRATIFFPKKKSPLVQFDGVSTNVRFTFIGAEF